MAECCLSRSAREREAQVRGGSGDASACDSAQDNSADSVAAKHANISAGLPNIVVYLPRDTSVSGLANCLAPPVRAVQPLCLERNILNYQLKSLTLYARAMV
jgi:hypothetical protein